MDEFLEQFVIESRELLTQANLDLLAIENTPDDRQRIDSAFRAFHTLKGGASIVDFTAMAKAVHTAEDMLAAVRAGDRKVTVALVSSCLACLDHVQRWLDAMEASGEIPPSAEAEAAQIIARFAQEELPGQSAPESKGPSPAIAHGLADSMAAAILDAQLGLLTDTTSEGRTGRWHAAVRSAANVLRASGRVAEADHIETISAANLKSGDATAVIAAIGAARMAPLTGPNTPALATHQELSPRTFRVDGERVETLVNLTGELTVAKNAIGHLVKLAQEAANPLAPTLRAQHNQIDRLISALQHTVLGMRVLPLRHVFQRLQRLVREMAVSLQKPTRLSTEGDDTEADKAVVEALYEPLLHILRNAMDHGIESAATRATAGKPAVATIQLRAFRSGEHVIVEVGDDGGGIDVARVRAVAVERKIASADRIAALSDDDAINLIFEPGFSTADQVTSHSGRGVGMDAVRTSVERLGGEVVVETSRGQGTTVRLKLPFSVMMTQVMTVEVGGQVFGIPLDAVIETLRVPRAHIQSVGDGWAIVHRGRTLPVVNLAQTLGTEKPVGLHQEDAEATLVVILAAGQTGAVEVDYLGVRAEVMLKPMHGLLANMPDVSGTTLLGDGSVLIVLNMSALFA